MSTYKYNKSCEDLVEVIFPIHKQAVYLVGPHNISEFDPDATCKEMAQFQNLPMVKRNVPPWKIHAYIEAIRKGQTEDFCYMHDCCPRAGFPVLIVPFSPEMKQHIYHYKKPIKFTVELTDPNLFKDAPWYCPHYIKSHVLQQNSACEKYYGLSPTGANASWNKSEVTDSYWNPSQCEALISLIFKDANKTPTPLQGCWCYLSKIFHTLQFAKYQQKIEQLQNPHITIW
jgi:hypothetical protein